mgnify:CR=1 FL=1
MSELASAGQLRAGLLRWALVLVPGILLLGILSGSFAGSGPDNAWFSALEKPPTYPPPATFGIVWTILYILMGVALAVVVTARGARLRKAAIWAFAIQFLLNLAWSPVFFGLHEITWALVMLVAIDISVLVTLVLFWKVRPLAGGLLVPYMAWVLFATVLNFQFLQLNPQLDGEEPVGPRQRIEFGQ